MPAPAKPRLVVLQLEPAGGVDPKVASVLTESVTAEVAATGLFDVLSSKEIQTILGAERQRQMMGCAEGQSTCLAEIADAMGARFVLSGSVAKLGDAFQLNLQTLDSVRAQPIGRATRIASDLSALSQQLPYAVAEATATPLPPPPSRVLPYSMMAGGGLVAVVGGLLTFNALSRESAVNRELENGESNPAALKPLEAYRLEQRQIMLEKMIGLSVLGVGAGLVVGGISLNPTEGGGRGPRSSVKVALIPAEAGIAVVGVWP